MKILFLIAMFFPFQSIAERVPLNNSMELVNLSGQWSGEAQLTTKTGDVYLCEGVSIDVKQMSDHAEFGKFRYTCGGVVFTFVPPTLQIQKDKVFYKNQFVGQLTDKAANLLFVINDQNGRARYTLKKIDEKTIDYLDEQIDFNQHTGKDEIMSIHGILSKICGASCR